MQQRLVSVGSLAVMACLVPASSMAAQSVDVGLAFNQSFTSVESIRSPAGWRIGVHAPEQIGRIGFQAGYRHLSEDLGEIPGYCGLFCVDGPFDQTALLRTLDMGLMYAVLPGAPASLNVGLAGSFSWQNERLEHLQTRDVSSRSSVGPDFGLGIFAEARVPPLAFGFQPVAYARYDRIGANACVPDGTCFGGRNVATFGLGLAFAFK